MNGRDFFLLALHRVRICSCVLETYCPVDAVGPLAVSGIQLPRGTSTLSCERPFGNSGDIRSGRKSELCTVYL